MAGGWTNRPTGFADQVERDTNKQLRALAMQALTGVIERSPVDTGRFRGNSHVSVGQADNGYDLDKQDTTGSATLNEGMQIIGRVTRPFEVIYIQNNLPYSEELERGSSTQAPQGVFEITFNSLVEASR